MLTFEDKEQKREYTRKRRLQRKERRRAALAPLRILFNVSMIAFGITMGIYQIFIASWRLGTYGIERQMAIIGICFFLIMINFGQLLFDKGEK